MLKAAFVTVCVWMCLHYANAQSCPQITNVAELCVPGEYSGARVLIDMTTYVPGTSCACTYNTTANILRAVTYNAPNYQQCNSAVRMFPTVGSSVSFQCLVSGTYLDTSESKSGVVTLETYGEPNDVNYCLVLQHGGEISDNVHVTCTGPEATTAESSSSPSSSASTIVPDATTSAPLLVSTTAAAFTSTVSPIVTSTVIAGTEAAPMATSTQTYDYATTDSEITTQKKLSETTYQTTIVMDGKTAAEGTAAFVDNTIASTQSSRTSFKPVGQSTQSPATTSEDFSLQFPSPMESKDKMNSTNTSMTNQPKVFTDETLLLMRRTNNSEQNDRLYTTTVLPASTEPLLQTTTVTRDTTPLPFNSQPSSSTILETTTLLLGTSSTAPTLDTTVSESEPGFLSTNTPVTTNHTLVNIEDTHTPIVDNSRTSFNTPTQMATTTINDVFKSETSTPTETTTSQRASYTTAPLVNTKESTATSSRLPEPSVEIKTGRATDSFNTDTTVSVSTTYRPMNTDTTMSMSTSGRQVTTDNIANDVSDTTTNSVIVDTTPVTDDVGTSAVPIYTSTQSPVITTQTSIITETKTSQASTASSNESSNNGNLLRSIIGTAFNIDMQVSRDLTTSVDPISTTGTPAVTTEYVPGTTMDAAESSDHMRTDSVGESLTTVLVNENITASSDAVSETTTTQGRVHGTSSVSMLTSEGTVDATEFPSVRDRTTTSITTDKITTELSLSVTTGDQAATSISPQVTTDVPSATSILPTVTTRVPAATSVSPSVSSEVEMATSIAPSVTTGLQTDTSMSPSVTSDIQSATSISSSLTTGVQTSTSVSPSVTSSIPAATSIDSILSTSGSSSGLSSDSIQTEIVTDLPNEAVTETILEFKVDSVLNLQAVPVVTESKTATTTSKSLDDASDTVTTTLKPSETTTSRIVEEIMAVEKVQVLRVEPRPVEIFPSTEKAREVVVDRIDPNQYDSNAAAEDKETMNVAIDDELDSSFFDMNNNKYILVVGCIAGLVILAVIVGIIINHARKRRSEKVNISDGAGVDAVPARPTSEIVDEVFEPDTAVGKDAATTASNGNV